jgi:rubredoxin
VSASESLFWPQGGYRRKQEVAMAVDRAQGFDPGKPENWCTICARTKVLIDGRYQCPVCNPDEERRRRTARIERAVDEAWETNGGRR